MSADDLLARLQAAPQGTPVDWIKIREEICEEFPKASTESERVILLAIFKAVMDQVERGLEGMTSEGQLTNFREARSTDYKSFIVEECLVGESVCVETLEAVTAREMAAGRMGPEHPLRDLAVNSMAAPHLTRQELQAAEAEKQRAKKPPETGLLGRVKGWIK